MIDLKVVGIRALTARLRKVKSKLKNRRDLNAKAVVVVDRWIQKNFQVQGAMSMGGSGWKPLKPATEDRRRKGKKKQLSNKILQDTGTLRMRWKHAWGTSFAKIQSGVPYGMYHHEGRGNLPERRILPTRPQVLPDITKLYKMFIKKAINDKF